MLIDRTEHKQLQEESSRYRDHLEELVAKRTAELQQINEQLRWEIATYQQIVHISSQEGIRLHEAVEALEKWLIINALEQHYWHRGKTAESLGIPRRSLQRKMNKYGLM
jgi:transcriptional regulator with PAS, ATPase and Fis domain